MSQIAKSIGALLIALEERDSRIDCLEAERAHSAQQAGDDSCDAIFIECEKLRERIAKLEAELAELTRPVTCYCPTCAVLAKRTYELRCGIAAAVGSESLPRSILGHLNRLLMGDDEAAKGGSDGSLH